MLTLLIMSSQVRADWGLALLIYFSSHLGRLVNKAPWQAHPVPYHWVILLHQVYFVLQGQATIACPTSFEKK